MRSIDNCAVTRLISATVATGSTADLCFDTSGFGHANIYVAVAATATNSTMTFATLALTESDTVTTATGGSSIVAFTGATETSTSAGFVIPTITGYGGVEFQVDLSKRKRYIGVKMTPTSTTATLSAFAILSSPKISADTAALKTLLNNSVTTGATMSTVVSG